jgi:hypothetical protein
LRLKNLPFKVTAMNGVREAIKKLGGLSATAREMGVTPQAVFRWNDTGVVPADRVPRLSGLTGVQYHRLNPIFPRPSAAIVAIQE